MLYIHYTAYVGQIYKIKKNHTQTSKMPSVKFLDVCLIYVMPSVYAFNGKTFKNLCII